MPQYTEDDVSQALINVANGKGVRAAARDWGVPYTTLRERIKGRENHSISAENQQRLSRVQEDHLANWVLAQEALGVPLTHAQIKEFAHRLLAIKGDHKPLGKRWMHAFLNRNPILKTKRFRNIDSQRVNGATTSIIKDWFQRLLPPQIQAIKPECRFNMDESGIMEGFGANGLVVGSSERRGIQKKQPGSKAWTSFLECVSATGVALSPLVIFKGKTVQQQWFPKDLDLFKDWQFTSTENGWTTDATAVEWLEKVFIPLTDTKEPRLLILDGHGSHETTNFMFLCYQHNIYLLFLPPHSSHVLQPLDLSVFSSLKSRY
jgi:4-hydroxybenzoate polyprenyltransferase